MRRLPLSLPEPVRKLLRWLDAAEVQPLAPDLVPGASVTELRRLAALGAVGRAMSPTAADAWPEPLQEWASTSADLDPALCEEILPLVNAPSGPDLLALTYEWVVSGTNRRRLGTFFTPPGLTQHMLAAVETVLPDAPRHVADPGAGVGAFTMAALERWPEARVSAVDVNVVTLGLLAARLARHSGGSKNRLLLESRDYLAWLNDTWPHLPGPKVIIGNPPYTRHQHMSAKDKQHAREAAGDLITSGLAGLSAYFLAASLRSLEAEDALCLLLPGSWCETRYGREVREWLWREARRKVELHMFPSRLEVFPGTQVTAMVLLVGPREVADQPFIARESDLVDDQVKGGRSVVCDRRQPCPATFTRILREHQAPLTASEPLGHFAKIRRGVATGASDYFFLTDANLQERNLPKQVVRAALVKPAHLPAPHLTTAQHENIGLNGKPRWLLDLNDHEDLAQHDEHVRSYIQTGLDRNIHLRHLTGLRDPWYAVEPVTPPDILLAPVGKDVHRIIVNDAKAVGSNNFYGIYLDPLGPWSPAALAAWMRSDAGQLALRALARNYQGGSLKIEPRSLRGLLVPVNGVGARLF